MWVKMMSDEMESWQIFISDQTKFEGQYVYGNQMFSDFNFNVARKVNVINTGIKVTVILLASTPIFSFLKVWSCLSGQMDYTEQKLLSLAQDIRLVETVQNYLPVIPSPILQQLFKQTATNKIKHINVQQILYGTDFFLGTWNIIPSFIPKTLF